MMPPRYRYKNFGLHFLYKWITDSSRSVGDSIGVGGAIQGGFGPANELAKHLIDVKAYVVVVAVVDVVVVVVAAAVVVACVHTCR